MLVGNQSTKLASAAQLSGVFIVETTYIKWKIVHFHHQKMKSDWEDPNTRGTRHPRMVNQQPSSSSATPTSTSKATKPTALGSRGQGLCDEEGRGGQPSECGDG